MFKVKKMCSDGGEKFTCKLIFSATQIKTFTLFYRYLLRILFRTLFICGFEPFHI